MRRAALLAFVLVASLLLAGCAAPSKPSSTTKASRSTADTEGATTSASTTTTTASTPPSSLTSTPPLICPSEPPRTTGPRRLPEWQPPADVEPAAGNFLHLDSDATDFAGAGRTAYFEPRCSFTVTQSARILRVTLDAASDWDLQFEHRVDQPWLQAGSYLNVTTPHANAPDEAGMQAHANRVCPASRSSFIVDEADYDAYGVLESITLRFEQHCEDAPPALLGKLRWSAP